jgi:GNAT superfamily N-acetyltransferase
MDYPQIEMDGTDISNPPPQEFIPEPTKARVPIYDNFGSSGRGHQQCSVKFVRDFEDMAKVIAIRASACFSDPEHLYAKHFDGSDFSSTHLLGYIGDEPVASVRIRYFANFARVERLTVRPTHRRSRIAFKVVQAAFALCRDKGFRRLSGVAREEMVPFWSLFGGSVSRSKDPIFIYGLPHYEMYIDFPEGQPAVTAESDPLVLLRPEGRWHEAGYHEHAAVTPTTDIPNLQPQVASLASRLVKRQRVGGSVPEREPRTAARAPERSQRLDRNGRLPPELPATG